MCGLWTLVCVVFKHTVNIRSLSLPRLRGASSALLWTTLMPLFASTITLLVTQSPLMGSKPSCGILTLHRPVVLLPDTSSIWPLIQLTDRLGDDFQQRVLQTATLYSYTVNTYTVYMIHIFTMIYFTYTMLKSTIFKKEQTTITNQQQPKKTTHTTCWINVLWLDSADCSLTSRPSLKSRKMHNIRVDYSLLPFITWVVW